VGLLTCRGDGPGSSRAFRRPGRLMNSPPHGSLPFGSAFGESICLDRRGPELARLSSLRFGSTPARSLGSAAWRPLGVGYRRCVVERPQRSAIGDSAHLANRRWPEPFRWIRASPGCQRRRRRPAGAAFAASMTLRSIGDCSPLPYLLPISARFAPCLSGKSAAQLRAGLAPFQG
jgi:hypothetical protein